MTAAPEKWAGVITAAETLQAAIENWNATAPTAGYRGSRMAGAASGLLAELANLWTVGGVLTSPGTPPTGPGQPTLATGGRAMADVWPVKFTGADRETFTAWLKKCQEAGAAQSMNDAIRLAVRLASSIPIEQLPKTGAGNQ